MFEVGKVYEHIENKRRIRVLWVGKEKMAVTYIYSPDDMVYVKLGDELFWPTAGLVHWKEYVEPKVVKQEFYVRCAGWRSGVEIFASPVQWVTGNSDQIIGRIRITHTEGQGLKVEVLG